MANLAFQDEINAAEATKKASSSPKPSSQPSSSPGLTDDPFGDEPSSSGSTSSKQKERPGQMFEVDQYGWIDVVQSTILGDLKAWGKATGQSAAQISWIYESQIHNNLFNAIQHELFAAEDEAARSGGMGAMFGNGAWKYTNTQEGMNFLLDWARNWVSGYMGVPLKRTGSGSGSGRRGSGGSGGPTAQDIRNQFDVEELTRAVNDYSRAILFTDHKDPKRVARDYIEAIVASGGEKKIDFETYVRQNLESSSRFKSIYANKPEHVSPEQYIAPYIQAAMSMARPEEAKGMAIEGAQIGASPEAFRERLERGNAFTGSAPFINQLEGRLRNLNSLFKG